MQESVAASDAMTRSLVALGHRRFAVLAGPRGLLTTRDRIEGFRAGLAGWSLDLDPASIVPGAFTRDGGYEAMSSVLAAGGPLPDCVFAVNDVMAVGAPPRLPAPRGSRPARI